MLAVVICIGVAVVAVVCGVVGVVVVVVIVVMLSCVMICCFFLFFSDADCVRGLFFVRRHHATNYYDFGNTNSRLAVSPDC